jgi:hypothetical protein
VSRRWGYGRSVAPVGTWTDWSVWSAPFETSGSLVARLVLTRGLGLVYLIAFIVAAAQFRPLLGTHGLEPAPRFLAAVPFRRAPSLFHLHYSDRFLTAVAVTGIVLSAAVVVGLVERAPLVVWAAVWLLLWALYLSIVNIGQTFYGFGWETLLLEAGFLAVFLGPTGVAAPLPILWLFRWLAFRVEFGAGLIKLRGDPCWRDLSCLRYHHETQPLPNPLSWWFHHLPEPLHRVEVAANHVAQLVLPVALFLPQPIAGTAAVLIIVTQCWLVASGNFSWLNLVTIVIVAAAVPDGLLGDLVRVPAPADEVPVGWAAVVLAVTALVVVLSYRPVRNLWASGQIMNTSFDVLRLVNTYGAFGHITKQRYELVIEGTTDEHLTEGTRWQAYEFKAKPGGPRRRPPQIAPYHLRIDWLMWFAAMSRPGAHPWLLALVTRLLQGDRATLRLLGHDPFDGTRPRIVRVTRYLYRFTSRDERRSTGQWWQRTIVGSYLPPVRLDVDGPSTGLVVAEP